MLARAQQSMLHAGMRHVHFVQADAQTYVFPSASFDLLYSRFGVMFFIDPLVAFANLSTALRPGGRLTFICWQALQHNPWMFIPMAAAAAHLPLPAPSDPTAPGPFAFADPQRVRSLLTSAGFRSAECHPLKETLTLGNDSNLDRTVEFVLQMGPTGSALRAHPAARERVAVAVREALRPYHSHDGVRMEAAAWIVTAQRTG